MNAIDLPSSAYQLGEQDCELWSDNVFPAPQVNAMIEQPSVNGCIPLANNLDFGAYDESYSTSDFRDPLAIWDEQMMSIAPDVAGTQSAQEETRR